MHTAYLTVDTLPHAKRYVFRYMYKYVYHSTHTHTLMHTHAHANTHTCIACCLYLESVKFTEVLRCLCSVSHPFTLQLFKLQVPEMH